MRNIPTVTKNLLILNILAFIAGIMLSRMGIDLNNILGLHFFLANDFHLWQVITYMFMHGSFMHILMNMFMLWMFGMVMENVWGPKKFLLYYIVTGIGAGLCQELAQYANYMAEGLNRYQYIATEMGRIPMENYLNLWTTVGASGAVYGVLLAFGLTFPNERMFIIPIPIPLKAKWIIMGSIAMELFSAMSTTNDGVAHLAHLGGMLFGFLLIRYWRKHPYSGGTFGMDNSSIICAIIGRIDLTVLEEIINRQMIIIIEQIHHLHNKHNVQKMIGTTMHVRKKNKKKLIVYLIK